MSLELPIFGHPMINHFVNYSVWVFTERDAPDMSLHTLRIIFETEHRYPEFSMHDTEVSRLKKSNEMQQYAHIYLLLNYSTCFGRPSRPSSGVRKTVFVLIWSRLRKLASQIAWSVPEVATTFLCTPGDGRDGYPKHVE